MSRPTRRVIASGIASWDVDNDANFDIITGGPFPMFQVSLVADLPTASSYDDCLAIVGTGASARMYISNGTSWELYDRVAANVPASTATTVSEIVGDFNDLLQALQDADIMAGP